MRFHITLILILSSLMTLVAHAQEKYLIEKNDILSMVIRKRYPTAKIWGKNGKLQEVLKNNPHIKNPDLIYPYRYIYFYDSPPEPVVEAAPEADQSSDPAIAEAPVEAPSASETDTKLWKVSAGYGFKIFSYEQQGDLGSADILVLTPVLNANIQLMKNNWSVWGRFESFRINYKARGTSDSENILNKELGLSYKKLHLSFSNEQHPIFRDTGSINMAKFDMTFAGAGYGTSWRLEGEKPTQINLKTLLKLPVSQSTKEGSLDIKSSGGYLLEGQLNLERLLLQKKGFDVYFDWQNELSYQPLEQKVRWEGVEGNLKSTTIQFSTSVGVGANF